MTILFFIALILIHVIVDANLISRKIKILHWLESLIFIALSAVYWLLTEEPWEYMLILGISLRMALFDILLNWCRFLPFDYIGEKSLWDKLQRKLGIEIRYLRYAYLIIAAFVIIMYLYDSKG